MSRKQSGLVPIGVLLLIGAVLYALPRSAVLGAIYVTALLGGAVAAHVRIGSPRFTHILFVVYVAVLMWAGLVLRRRRCWECCWNDAESVPRLIMSAVRVEEDLDEALPTQAGADLSTRRHCA